MKPLIVLGISGSIAAVRSFDLCRELQKKGFEVQVVMSESSHGIVTENAMEFASGRKVISKLSGKMEHVKLFGQRGSAKLFLIAPATANTISKIAMGIDDTPITTCATVAIGSGKTVLLAPAMHKPMYEHPIVIENLEKLKNKNVRIISPLEEDGKAKLASIEGIIFEVEKALADKKFSGKKILVASGAFREEIDDVRFVSNKSSGKLGVEISLELARQGGEVKLVGNGDVPAFLDFEKEHYAISLEKKVLKELEDGYDYFFCPAAIPDFSVKKTSGKISSEKSFEVKFEKREKLLEKVRKKFPKLKIVAFKGAWNKNKKEIQKICTEFLNKNKLFAVVATDLKKFSFESEEKEMMFCSKKCTSIRGARKELAKKIIWLV